MLYASLLCVFGNAAAILAIQKDSRKGRAMRLLLIEEEHLG